MAAPRNDKLRKQVVALLDKGWTRWAISQELKIQVGLVNYYAKTRLLGIKK